MARQTPALSGRGSLKPPARVTRGLAGEGKQKGRAAPASGPAGNSPPPAGCPLLRPAPLLAPTSRRVQPLPFKTLCKINDPSSRDERFLPRDRLSWETS